MWSWVRFPQTAIELIFLSWLLNKWGRISFLHQQLVSLKGIVIALMALKPLHGLFVFVLLKEFEIFFILN